MTMIRLACVLLFATTLASSKPIMVTFGTNQGPIVPKQSTTTARPRPDVTPAPVSERSEDVPNPDTYRAPVPHQYRKKIYSHKPHPNLILGTPLDVRFTPGLNKYSDKWRRQQKSLGVAYTGPQFFEKQEYEYELEKRKSPSPSPAERSDRGFGYDRRVVPQIGIVYSSGLRYYVPQIFDYSNEEDSNSVYDVNDSKYYDERKYSNRDYYY